MVKQLEKPAVHVIVSEAETDATSESIEIRPSHHFDGEEPQRRIRFAPEMDILEIPTREELTDDEYYLSFYSKEEFACMNEAQNETADRMERGKKAKKSTAYRGLEAWTQEGQREMNQRIFACVDSVLDEQDRQWKCGRDSVRRIAKVYRSLTKTSKSVARKLARQDENEACKIYKQYDGKDCRVQEEDDIWEEPLRLVIESSTVMKKKKKKKENFTSSGRSIDSMDTMSVNSDSADSAFWSLNSSSLFDMKPVSEIPKKRKCKKKSAARFGEECPDSPAKTTASRRKSIKNEVVV